MPVRNKVSTVFGVTGAAGYTPPNAAARDGRIHRVAGRITNAADDDSGSTFLMAEIPWAAILLHASLIRTDQWGYAQAVIGVPGTPTGLLNVARATGGTSGNLPVTAFGADWNLPFWQQLGLSAMPTTPFAALTAFAQANATGAGTLDFDLHYALHI